MDRRPIYEPFHCNRKWTAEMTIDPNCSFRLLAAPNLSWICGPRLFFRTASLPGNWWWTANGYIIWRISHERNPLISISSQCQHDKFVFGLCTDFKVYTFYKMFKRQKCKKQLNTWQHYFMQSVIYQWFSKYLSLLALL